MGAPRDIHTTPAGTSGAVLTLKIGAVLLLSTTFAPKTEIPLLFRFSRASANSDGRSNAWTECIASTNLTTFPLAFTS